MPIIESILTAFAATSVMTVFSYIVSGIFRQLYKEPVLLSLILTSYQKKWSRNENRTAGWILHYLIGLSFVIAYFLPVWMGAHWYPINATTGSIFGTICGISGIFGWAVMFHYSSDAPPVKLPGYFLQLFIAHIIFGITAALTHLAFNEGF